MAASVSEQTLLKLKKFDYTHLTIQVGDLEDFFNRTKPKDTKGIVVKSFTFKRDGLTHNMKKCRAKPGVSEEGLVICHAGWPKLRSLYCVYSDFLQAPELSWMGCVLVFLLWLSRIPHSSIITKMNWQMSWRHKGMSRKAPPGKSIHESLQHQCSRSYLPPIIKLLPRLTTNP